MCTILALAAMLFAGCSSLDTNEGAGEKIQTIRLSDYFGEDVSGKSLYFIKINPTNSVIKAEDVSYIAHFSGIERATPPMQNERFSTLDFSSHRLRVPMIKAQSIKPARTAKTPEPPSFFAQPLVEGETRRELFVDKNQSLSVYKLAGATLRSIGTECLVWVVDGNFAGESENAPITAELSADIAAKFDEMCPKIRAIFGHESDEIYAHYGDNGWEKMRPRDPRVNIVIYDIGADCGADGGVQGYFYSRDYFSSAKNLSRQGFEYKNPELCASNEGKFIYLDAASVAKKRESAYSTLAHEFQHMVSYGVKTMQKGISTTAFHEEMMSLLCEDMLQDSLGVPADESVAARLPFFEAHYSEIGLEYRESFDGYFDILSYAANYAFGSWLVRNFGGTALLYEMAHNDFSGFDCALSAVNAVNKTAFSAQDMLLLYAQGCALKSAPYSHNRAVFDGTFALKAIDLWNLGLSQNAEYVQNGYFSYSGCTLFAPDARLELRPYGMTLSKAGKIQNEEASITIVSGKPTAEVWRLFAE